MCVYVCVCACMCMCVVACVGMCFSVCVQIVWVGAFVFFQYVCVFVCMSSCLLCVCACVHMCACTCVRWYVLHVIVIVNVYIHNYFLSPAHTIYAVGQRYGMSTTRMKSMHVCTNSLLCAICMYACTCIHMYSTQKTMYVFMHLYMCEWYVRPFPFSHTHALKCMLNCLKSDVLRGTHRRVIRGHGCTDRVQPCKKLECDPKPLWPRQEPFARAPRGRGNLFKSEVTAPHEG